MELRFLDKNLERIGVADELISCIWTIKYFDVGEVKILAPVSDVNRELFQVGNIVTMHDANIEMTDADGEVWRRAAEITYIHYTKDSEGQEQIEAQGKMLSSWFNQRVITPQLSMNGTIQEIVNKLVEKNCGSDAISRRQFPGLSVIEQADLGGSAVDYSHDAYAYLGDEIKDLCQSGKIGFDILLNERSQKLGFYLYKGNDLTRDNTDGNNPCIFSRDHDNISSQEYEDSTESLKNYAYVMGEEDDDGNAPVVEVGEESEGLDLYESFVSGSDISRTAENEDGEEITIPDATYQSLLETKGNTELAECIETYTFNSVINTRANLTYKEDYDIGDRITCIEKRWGLMIDSRITSITLTYEEGKALIEATFGESQPTLLSKIKKAR